MRILTRPDNSLANFSHQISKKKLRSAALRMNSLATANGFANEVAKVSSSLRKFLANGSLRQNSLAVANAMAWCTQLCTEPDQALSINLHKPALGQPPYAESAYFSSKLFANEKKEDQS